MKKVIYIIQIVLIGLLLQSCEDDFLERAPTDEVESSKAIENTTNGYAIVNGIHRELYTRQEAIQGNAGVGGHYILMDLAGEDQVFHRNQWHSRVYNWQAGRRDNDFYSRFPWVMFYKFIANANILINNMDNAEGELSDKNIIKGQAFTYRAWSHFHLVQIYGDRYVAGGANDQDQSGIPYKKSELEEKLPRNTVNEVYIEILKDLDEAISLFMEEGYNGGGNKSNLGLDVAKGIKARVLLTQGRWSEAASLAAEVKNNYSLMDADTYKTAFSINTSTISEFIWSSTMTPDQNDTFGSYGAYISRNFSSSAIRGNPRSIFSRLYDLISDTDVRKTLWDPTGDHLDFPPGYVISSRHQRWPYTNQKFLAAGEGDSRLDVPHMRAAEMYLIEAEAMARNGQDVLAAQVLFDLISTRDNAYTLSANTGQALIDEIMIHRRIELWGEGFRFYDLKRLNLPLDRTGGNHISTLVNNVFEVAAGDIRWEWLIPIEEINANPNMMQNPR